MAWYGASWLGMARHGKAGMETPRSPFGSGALLVDQWAKAGSPTSRMPDILTVMVPPLGRGAFTCEGVR